MGRLLTIVLAWLIPSIAIANPQGEVSFKGGPNAATQARKYRYHKYGLSGGLAGGVERALTERLSLGGQVEILYTPRGSKILFEGEGPGWTWMHYLDLMVMARPRVRFGRASVYLLLGGGLCFLLSANQVSSTGGGEDLDDTTYRLDVALLAGAGVALHLPRRGPRRFRLDTLFLEARHDHGLLDADIPSGGFENRTSSLMLGLSFAVAGAAE
jgi:hypothetical protein